MENSIVNITNSIIPTTTTTHNSIHPTNTTTSTANLHTNTATNNPCQSSNTAAISTFRVTCPTDASELITA